MITLSLFSTSKQIPPQTWSFSEDTSPIRIGRAADNHVVLYSAVVSRYHVEVCHNGVSWEIVNRGTNGTYLVRAGADSASAEGKRIDRVPAEHGTIFRLAQSGPRLQVQLGVADASTPPHLPEQEPQADHVTSVD